MSSIKTALTVASFAAAGLAAPFITPRATTNDFHKAATAKGKLWFGSEIDTIGSTETTNTAYMTIWNNTDIFGQTTPGNSMKWEFVEPEQNTFTFADAMETVDLAKATDKQIRCHNLVWSSELPSWVTGGTWTNATLLAAMKNHITKTIQYFGDDCHSWDVVNEALTESGDGYESNVFLTYIGEAYVPLAFQYAREAAKANDLSVHLFYNDYGIESTGTKATAALELIKTIKAYGDNIDGVGLESHFSTSYYPTAAAIESAMTAYAALDLNIHITELDVATPSDSPTTAQLATQAQAYYNTISACMNTARCLGMTVWDFDSAYSWIQPSSDDGEGEADLYSATLTAHPAVTAVMEAIEGEACSVC